MEPGNTEHYLEQLNLTEMMEQLNRCFSSAFLADFSLEQLFYSVRKWKGGTAAFGTPDRRQRGTGVFRDAADFIGFIAARHPVGAGLLPDGKL